MTNFEDYENGEVPPIKPTPKEWLAESKKAIYAFIATAIVAYFRRIGVQLDETEIVDVLTSIGGGLLTAVFVWWTKNRPQWLRGSETAEL